MTRRRHRIKVTCLAATLFLFSMVPLYAEWPVEGIELLPTQTQVGRMQTVPDTSGGIWLIFDSTVPYSSFSESRSADLKSIRQASVTQGYLRIQHVDSSGVKLYGDWGRSVIQDTTDTLAWFHGAVPTSDGGVIVAYTAYTPYYSPDSSFRYYGVYGQRFSASGEAMWHKYGEPLITGDGTDYIGNLSYPGLPPYVCCTDSADGVWLIAYVGLSMKVHLTHVLSDGTLDPNIKHLYTVGSGANIRSWDRVGICEDGSGGMFVGFVNDDDGHFWFQHFTHSGITGAGIAISDPRNSSGVTATPDGFGGVYFMIDSYGDDADVQRVNSQNEVVYQGSNKLIIGEDTTCKWPAILPNGDAVFIYTLNDDSLRYARYNLSLEPQVDGVSIGSLGALSSLISISNGEDVLVSARQTMSISSQWYANITMHRLPYSGVPDLWEDSSKVLVWDENGNTANFTFQRFTRLSDGFLLIQYTYDSGLYRLHRISEDGPPVSDTTQETPPAVLPDHFEIESVWPNPFNGSVTIRMMLPENKSATLLIYDLMGRLVDSKEVPTTSLGASTIIWKPKKHLASGIYFVRASSANETSPVKKLILIR